MVYAMLLYTLFSTPYRYATTLRLPYAMAPVCHRQRSSSALRVMQEDGQVRVPRPRAMAESQGDGRRLQTASERVLSNGTPAAIHFLY